MTQLFRSPRPARAAVAWTVALTLLFPARLAADALTPITLDEVIEGALQHSVGLNLVQRDYQDKLADSTEASILDNPQLQTDVERTRGQAGSGVAVELTQPLKISQLTGSRWRYADVLRTAASQERQFAILKTINDTTALYLQLWLLQERRRLFDASAQDAQTMSKLVKAAASQGQTSDAAFHLFAADAVRLKSEAEFIDAELRQARTSLAKLTGRSFELVTLQKPSFSPVPESTSRLVEFAQDRANLRKIVKTQVEAAERRLSIANQDAALPNLSPRLLYSQAPGGDQRAYGIGVQLSLPLWNQNDAERRRAKADLRAVQTQADLLAAIPATNAIPDLQQSARSAADRADRYTQSVLPDYRRSYELTRTMFRQGQLNALDVWQVRERLYQTESDALQAVVDAFNARSALEFELGGKLEELP